MYVEILFGRYSVVKCGVGKDRVLSCGKAWGCRMGWSVWGRGENTKKNQRVLKEEVCTERGGCVCVCEELINLHKGKGEDEVRKEKAQE